MTIEKKKTVKARLFKNVEEKTYLVQIKTFFGWKFLTKETTNNKNGFIINEIQKFKSKSKAIKGICEANSTKKELLNIELYPTVKVL